MNLYGFAGGDPVNFSDPFGLCPACIAYQLYEGAQAISSWYKTNNVGKILHDAAMMAGAPGNGMAVRGAAGAVGRAAAVGRNPLEGTTYTGKVRQDMRKGDLHGFPAEVDNFAGDGTISSLRGGDGTMRTKVELRGSYKGKDGAFEWIIEPDQSINHRYFKPDPKYSPEIHIDVVD